MNGFLPISALVAGLLLAGSVPAAPDHSCQGDLDNLDGVDYTAFDVAAALQDSVPAAYPDIALRSLVEGTVELAVAVTAAGDPFCASVLQSAHPLLDREAVKAALASRYAAARRDGRPVPGIATVSYLFDREETLRRRHRERNPEPFPWTSPMVSEAADSVSVHRDGRTTFHWLRGVRIHGDLSVEVFDRVLAVVGERNEGNGRIEAVWMYTAEWSEVPWGPENFADIRVDVRTGEGMDTVRNHYFFNRRGDRFELTGTSLSRY